MDSMKLICICQILKDEDVSISEGVSKNLLSRVVPPKHMNTVNAEHERIQHVEHIKAVVYAMPKKSNEGQFPRMTLISN